jgi:hypothetical protein
MFAANVSKGEVMRLLPLTITLLACSALAEDDGAAARAAREPGPADEAMSAKAFRLSGNLDLGAVSADGDELAPAACDIPSNAPSSELRTWRLRETVGYYSPGREGPDRDARARF